jgi:hypothetical protein
MSALHQKWKRANGLVKTPLERRSPTRQVLKSARESAGSEIGAPTHHSGNERRQTLVASPEFLSNSVSLVFWLYVWRETGWL